MCRRLSRLRLGSHTFSSRQYSCGVIPKTTKLQALQSSSNRGTSTRGLPAVLLNQFSKHYHYFGYKRLWNDKHGTLGEITRKQLYDPPAVKRFFSARESPLHSVVCKDNSAIFLVHVKRRMLSTSTSCNVGFRLTHMTKIAGAVSLACFRSHLTPRILAAIIGPVALARNVTAEAEALQSNYSLRSQTLDRHAFFTTHMWLLLEAIVLTFRMFYLFILCSPAIITAPLVWNVEEGRLRALWLKLVHKTLEQAGAAFIKWGQWAATRPDLFPRDLCMELSQLHSKAPAHKFSYTKNTIERAFGRKINEIFEDFEEEPVASGSIAQVHKASLRFRYPGQKMKPITVAVKVRHPRVSEDIRRDFIIINWIAKVTSILPPLRWLRLEESVQQFAVFMLSQVDLAREAAQLSRFLYNFRRWKDVSFPKPLYPLVHPAVLVETYEHGESVARYVDQPEPDNRLNRSLAHIGTHTLLKMLLVDNFIHADMHPGNILVRVGKGGHSNKRLFRSKPHVIFLDVGMTAELSPTDRVNLLEFFKAVALRDGRTAAECTLKFSRHQSCPDREAFIKEVEQSFKFWGSPDSDDVHPAECMQNLLDQVRRHKVNIDGNVCTVMVTTLVLEGWQRKLDPQYNVMDTLQKLLFRADWAKSLSYTIEGLMAP